MSDNDRYLAFADIKAATYFDLDVKEENWRQIGKRLHTKNSAQE
jgi:hypothetical protein